MLTDRSIRPQDRCSLVLAFVRGAVLFDVGDRFSRGAHGEVYMLQHLGSSVTCICDMHATFSSVMLWLYLQRSKNACLQQLFEKGDVTDKTLVAGLIGRCVYRACADEYLLQQSLQPEVHTVHA